MKNPSALWMICVLSLVLSSKFTCGVEGAGGSCCKGCICTRSIPPQCQCTDVKSYCDKACKSCRCTRSIPPQCRCMDIKDHCTPPSCNKLGN